MVEEIEKPNCAICGPIEWPMHWLAGWVEQKFTFQYAWACALKAES